VSEITNLLVLTDESAPEVRNSIVELLQDAGVDHLDLRGKEDATVPKFQEHDGPNWILVDAFPADLQGASTVWIGKGSPEQAATFNIDAEEKTTTQVINEVNDLVKQAFQKEVEPEVPPSLYAVWPEATDEGMLALTQAGELVLTHEPTVPHPDPKVARVALNQWLARIQKALDVPEQAAEPQPGTPEPSPAPAKLKYLNYRPTDDGEETL
jgi:hypothetical protein